MSWSRFLCECAGKREKKKVHIVRTGSNKIQGKKGGRYLGEDRKNQGTRTGTLDRSLKGRGREM